MDTHQHDHVHPDDPHAEAVVHISCARHTYEGGASVHLCGLDFVAHRGRRVAVLGPNGAGKTTMLYHVLGLLKPSEGVVTVFGVPPAEKWTEIRSRIGVVLQNVDEQLLMPTVFDDVAFAPRQYGLPEAEVRARVERALAELRIAPLADRVPHNLSGGEKRKVALAGAIVMDPELLVLDEPFEGLDPESRAHVLELLERLSKERGMTIVLTTHDIDAVPEFADYAYVLAPGGTIAVRGTPEEVFANASALRASNIRPPILAELFERLRAERPDAPEPVLTIEDAAYALARWRSGTSRQT
jgi:cobalt/nickel transport system ATP-binding protein